MEWGDRLTYEQIRILLELQDFARKPQSLTGERYQTVTVPSAIFDRLILGLPHMPKVETTVVAGPFGRRIEIANAVEKTVAEYVRANPDHQDPSHLKWIRLQAENKAIIDLLQSLHERGKL